MNMTRNRQGCDQGEMTSAFALRALAADEMQEAEAHIATCADCQRELESLRPVIHSLVNWPQDMLQPSASLWDQLASRIAPEARGTPGPVERRWSEPEWEDVGPGISCKVLASDHEAQQVSMLVRLAPGAAYPPHRHAGVEELHLLDGELWIDDRKLRAGDYYRAEPGTSDNKVWSETGCTCVLITSPRDTLL